MQVSFQRRGAAPALARAMAAGAVQKLRAALAERVGNTGHWGNRGVPMPPHWRRRRDSA
ncbi:exported hypothetical protein [Cupriavidus taiwanensis]|uniref:Uncharacterized protein n=1 Tax=Cupriavidus taiwanensis TaxID=164546 RepID=A0A375J916_9BURK|nr:exported hypothetical protein [Cupriavidus taiwanensis]